MPTESDIKNGILLSRSVNRIELNYTSMQIYVYTYFTLEINHFVDVSFGTLIRTPIFTDNLDIIYIRKAELNL